MNSTDIKPCAINTPVSAHITFHYKPATDRSSSCCSSSAGSNSCSPRGSSAGLPPTLSSENEIIETVLNVSAPAAADPTPPSLFKSNYTAAVATRSSSCSTSPSRRNSVLPAGDFHQCAHHKNFQRRASEPQLPSFEDRSSSEMKRSVSYAQHNNVLFPIRDLPEPQTPDSHSDSSCPCNRHHHRRNSVAVKFDKPLYKRLYS
ncbi:hypothetical protein SEUBUCD646_0N03280 [Saccharomyces eubayanus]|uniref:Uncharacterized protein n=1 Tax=Saccharomyces pastorianus TaxID=27292 RepID=A0A6C1EFY5_SACPS|nr:hypothetical protein GRS66_010471 [Saccharomyces pastorianus]CAI1726948.1 hypothetical protein SEUBUCD646_0N03280 [Saccharomyces eubayanus]